MLFANRIILSFLLGQFKLKNSIAIFFLQILLYSVYFHNDLYVIGSFAILILSVKLINKNYNSLIVIILIAISDYISSLILNGYSELNYLVSPLITIFLYVIINKNKFYITLINFLNENIEYKKAIFIITFSILLFFSYCMMNLY